MMTQAFIAENAKVDFPIYFGPFCLHPERHLLLEDGRPISVGTRALEILIALTERAGELVSKDELFARAWPNAVVEESNLRAQIAVLRKALREGEAGSRYITAVPGRGYRFVAAAVRAADPQAPVRLVDRVNKLPVRLTKPIGRGDAISTVTGRLLRHRLTTIVGPGGIGKTTVGLAAAEVLSASFEDGVAFLDLAPINDPRLLPSVLATAVDLISGSEDPLFEIAAYLRQRQMLLVFDGCEHLVGTAAKVVETVLKDAPGVHILATSREPLRAEGESVYRLAPLETPPASVNLTAAEALAFPAVELFVERAASGGNGFELTDSEAAVVASICRQLDGIALAIELAAGRVDAFGTRGVAERLDDRLRLLAGGRRTAEPRQQTLRAMLDWSYEFLEEDEQIVLRRLGVFPGDFTFESACAVVTLGRVTAADVSDHLANLVAKSLIAAETGGLIARYRLLDTTRAYALAKLLENGEYDSIARRLAEYLKVILEHAQRELESKPGADWLVRCGDQLNNIRTALTWAFSDRGDAELGVTLTLAAIPLWFQLSLVSECLNGVQRALESVTIEETRHTHARQVMQLYRALGLSRVFSVAPQASFAFEKALQLAERIGDTEEQLEAIWGLWYYLLGTGNHPAVLEAARRFCAIATTEADRLIGDRLMSMPLFCMGEHTAARCHIERVLARHVPEHEATSAVRFRFDQAVPARVLLARLLWIQGFPDQATRAATSAVDVAQATSHAISLCDAYGRGVCPVAIFVGDLERADQAIDVLVDHAVKHSLEPWRVFAQCWKGALLVKKGEFGSGIALLRPGLVELRLGGLFTPYLTGFIPVLAEALIATDQFSEALATTDEGLAVCERQQEFWCIPELLRMKGEILLQLMDPTGAEQHFQRSIDWARRQKALSWELRTARSLAQFHKSRLQIAKARDILETVYGQFTEGFGSSDLQAARSLLASLR